MEQLNREAKLAYVNSDYQNALTAYEKIIDIQKAKNHVDGAICLNAGICAWEVKEYRKCIDYLELAKQTSSSNSKSLSTLAKAYKEIDNLSREINYLEEYLSAYPDGDEVNQVRIQLFEAYVDSQNWDLAHKLWSNLPSEGQKDKKLLVGYLLVNNKLGFDDQRDKIAAQLLKMDKNSIDALEVLAEKYFWLAENSYQKEMEAYSKNKTNKQYSQLLKALETINENLKTSRDYFERLYKLDPKPKYATFLGNIYTRFENTEKADFYYRKAKEGR
jgi:tetratricopeptide (TPR) repeat protein